VSSRVDLLSSLGKDSESFSNLGLKLIFAVNGSKDLRGLHLKKHTSDLGGLVGVLRESLDNKRVQGLTEELLLSLRGVLEEILEIRNLGHGSRRARTTGAAGVRSVSGRIAAHGAHTVVHVATHTTVVHRHALSKSREVGVEHLGTALHGSTEAVSMLHLVLHLLTEVLSLVKSNIDGLALNRSGAHLRNSLGSLLRSGEADKGNTSVGTISMGDELDRGDGTELGEESSETVRGHVLREELEVQVAASPSLLTSKTSLLVILTLLTLALSLLESTASIELLGSLALTNNGVHSTLDGSSSLLVGGEVDETETATLVGGLVVSNNRRGDATELTEELVELGLIPADRKVLHVDVGEGVGNTTTLLLGLVRLDSDSRTVDKETAVLGGLDSLVGVLLSLEVNETIANRLALAISADLGGSDVTEARELVIEALVVDALGEVLDESVTDTVAASGGVTLGPAHAASLALDVREVQEHDSTLSILGLLVVDITIAERAASGGITGFQ